MIARPLSPAPPAPPRAGPLPAPPMPTPPPPARTHAARRPALTVRRLAALVIAADLLRDRAADRTRGGTLYTGDPATRRAVRDFVHFADALNAHAHRRRSSEHG